MSVNSIKKVEFKKQQVDIETKINEFDKNAKEITTEIGEMFDDFKRLNTLKKDEVITEKRVDVEKKLSGEAVGEDFLKGATEEARVKINTIFKKLDDKKKKK